MSRHSKRHRRDGYGAGASIGKGFPDPPLAPRESSSHPEKITLLLGRVVNFLLDFCRTSEARETREEHA